MLTIIRPQPQARSTTVRSVLSRAVLEHPYHRLQAIPAAHRSFTETRYLRDDGSHASKTTEADQKISRTEDNQGSVEKRPATTKTGGKSITTPKVAGEPKERNSTGQTSSSSKVDKSERSSSATLAFDDWETNPNFDISNFSELPHSNFGVNQHIIIDAEFKEALRQIPWQFRAPIRYAFAYGSGVFPQSKSDGRVATPEEIARVHPKVPPAVQRAQDGTPKMIDFIFGVTFTQHWHSLNLKQHRDHYSGLGSLGSSAVSYVQDHMGAGVYFNTHVVVNGILIKYGVVNIDTLCRDLTDWDSLYLAGRLHKPVKILRDDARVRLANQMNLLSALRTALLLLPEKFTEKELYNTIAGISYLGDPRMTLPTENPQKVSNIVGNNLPNFRRLYNPLLETLPNVEFDSAGPNGNNSHDNNFSLRQDMNPVRRGNMVRRLPKSFRSKLYFQYQKKFAIPQLEFDAMMESGTASSSSATASKGTSQGFEIRIAQDNPMELTTTVRKVIKQTIGWPSTTQSMKGLLTGGLKKSVGYVWEKVEKYRAGQAKAASEKEREQKSSEGVKDSAPAGEKGGKN